MYLTTAFKNNDVYSVYSSKSVSVCTYNHNSEYDTDREGEEEQATK